MVGVKSLFAYSNHMKKIFFLITLISLSAWAERKCTFEGKEFDIYKAANRDTFSGVVKCKSEFSKETIEEEQTYKNGRVLEEKFDGPNRKETLHYSPDSPNQWRHGEQIEYYPKTNKIRHKENYNKMHKIGLQEKFYEGGQIEEREFYVQEKEGKAPTRAAAVGYLDNGDIQYLQCSKDKKSTIEPKACGFEGLSKIALRSKKGETQKTVSYLNGNIQEEEMPFESFSARGSFLFNGTFKDSKAKLIKITHTGEAKKYLFLYENGKTKREFSTGERGQIEGKDIEYFQNGNKARKTEFVKGEAQNGECWWENGKPRARYEKEADGLRATLIWDTGVENYKGSFVLNNRYDQTAEEFVQTMLGCREPGYSFERQGPFIELNKEGLKISEGAFEKGEPKGWHKIYDKKGELAEEKFYEVSQKPHYVSEKKIYENGKLTKHEKFNSDGSIKN